MNFISVSAVMAIFSTSIQANANDCFCLVDRNDNFRHSCEEQQQGIRKAYLCLASDDSPIKMVDLNGWRRLENGEGRCRPCIQREKNAGINLRD